MSWPAFVTEPQYTGKVRSRILSTKYFMLGTSWLCNDVTGVGSWLLWRRKLEHTVAGAHVRELVHGRLRLFVAWILPAERRVMESEHAAWSYLQRGYDAAFAKGDTTLANVAAAASSCAHTADIARALRYGLVDDAQSYCTDMEVVSTSVLRTVIGPQYERPSILDPLSASEVELIAAGLRVPTASQAQRLANMVVMKR